MIKLILKYSFLVIALLLLEISFVYAHPGRTDSSGGHTCRTNCESWGLEYGEYHYHTPKPLPPDPPPPPVITYKNITETETINFQAETIDDPNIEKGKEEIRREGENGTKSISYKITYTDGQETNKEKTSEITTKEPKSKIIAKGSKETALVETVNTITDNKPSNNWLVWLLVSLGIIGLLSRRNKPKDDQEKKK